MGAREEERKIYRTQSSRPKANAPPLPQGGLEEGAEFVRKRVIKGIKEKMHVRGEVAWIKKFQWLP